VPVTELWLKKALGATLMPLSLVVVLLATGILLLWWNRTRILGRWLATAALVVLLCLAYGFPFDRVARDLERAYPALARPESAAGTRWIIVLGGGLRDDELFPLSSRLAEDSLYRLVESIRLHRAIPGSRIIVSGGALLNTAASAYTVRDLARALGVSDDAIVVEDRPRDTREEALYVRQRIGDDSLIIVTSAMHMPRAMMIFEAAGLRPVAAPTMHRLVTGSTSSHPGSFFPSAERIAVAQAAAYEVLGTWWASLRGTAGGRVEMR
jgi:uncharacterized SAM-binding protein YcdF (DUF218 family)